MVYKPQMVATNCEMSMETSKCKMKRPENSASEMGEVPFPVA